MTRIFQRGFEAESWDIFDYYDGNQSSGFPYSTAGGWSNVAYLAGFYTNGFDYGVNSTELYGGGRWRISNTGGAGQGAVYQWHGETLQRQGLLDIQNNYYFRFTANGGTTNYYSTKTIIYNQWYWLEWHYVLGDGAGGTFELKVDGETWISQTGIDTKESATDSYIRWQLLTGVGTGNYNPYHDDIVVNNTTNDGGPLENRSWPGEVGIFRLQPDGDGSVTEWTPTIIDPLVATDQSWDSTTSAYDTEVLADSPKLYWELNDTSGSTAVDSSGFSHDGTYGSGMTINQEGILNNSPGVAGDGSTNSYIEVANHADLNPTSALTLECWIKGMYGGDNYAGGTQAVLMQKHAQYSLRIDARYNNVDMYFSVWVGSTRYDLQHTFDGSSSTEPLEILQRDTRFHHVVCTYDGAYMRMYVDGTLRAETTRTGSLDTSTNVFRVGRGASGSTYVNTPAGAYDEVAIYATALSQARIMTHFSAGVESWQFVADGVAPLNAEGTNSRYADKSGNQRDDYLAIATTNKTHLVTAEDLDSGWPLVQGVGVWYGSRKSSPGVVKVAPVIKRNGNTTVGTAQYQSTSWHIFRQIWSRDPTDTTDWNPSKVNNAEYGVKSIA